MTRFPLLYADPAMSYRDKASAGKRGAAHKYPVMRAIDNAMIIDSYAEKDCTLFCWWTWPTRLELESAIFSVGFKYRTIAFIWVKTTTTGKIHRGMGHWTSANTEPCCVYTRGKDYPRPTRPLTVGQVVMAPVQEHSAKPPVVRDNIVQLMGDVKRAELFARGRADGWESFGIEVDHRLSVTP